MSRWLWILITLVVVAVGASGYMSLTKSLPVRTVEVLRGEVREFVDERGKTRLPETHLITMPFAGRIETITLVEGETIAAGDVVARVAQRDVDDEVAEAKAAVERLEASIAENADITVEKSTREQAELFVESMVATVAAAEAQKVAGKSRLDYSEVSLGRTRKLFETGAETQDDLDRAELNYVESQIDYRRDVLTAEAMKSMQAATNLLPRIVSEQIARKNLTEQVLAKQRAEAEARLRLARLKQERGVMTSPVAGVVLERLVRDEQHLPAGATLLRIGELEQLEVEADVLSEDVVRIRPGSEVEIYGPAVGAVAGEGVAGVVKRIHPAGFTKISSLGVEQQRVTVIVAFAAGVVQGLRERHSLGVDYRVRVRIFTAKQEDTLVLPRSTLFRGPNGDRRVFVIRNDRAVPQPVELGLMNDEVAEVTNGLAAGDTVIVAPETTLQANARVHAATD